MITLIMYNKRWRIKIGNENWEFEEEKDFKEVLEKLIEYKNKYGEIYDE